ncbi:MAG: tetratricopeptide repeat protein [Elusimicrobia bacterium]|nr:tetratricopeptide repeat protein [Elusimicrobiota bacterium]
MSRFKCFASITLVASVALFTLAAFAFSQDAADSIDVPNLSILEKERQLRSELESKIQTDILDPILGKGKAVVFVSIELDIVTLRQNLTQSGAGMSSKSLAQSGLMAETEYILPGIPKPKSLDGGPSEGKSQLARQERGAFQEKSAQKTIIKRCEIVILHDENLAKDMIETVRQRIVDALKQFTVKPEQIVFKPTRMEGKILDDFRQPAVYVPTLFALLLFLFLMFLFGPLSSFMRGYARLLERKEGTEVNVESEFKGTPGEEGGAGGIGGGTLGAVEGEMAAVAGKEEGGEEEMNKFEPFKYVNDENIKGLIYLLKREQPWVISVVLTYLKPEYAQKVLVSLPVELQARVAMETATIREFSREQVVAINQQIKERVNFVIGGIEPLVKMLEEAKSDIRDSILEYLKNEKPEVYEKLRKRLLLFEDLPMIPDKALAVAIRELKPSEIALALRQASPDVENKIFANLSSGAVNLVKEELELSSSFAPEQIERERQKILSIIKRMESEGKIVFRERPQTTVIDGIEEDEVKTRERERAWRLSASAAGGQQNAPAGPTSDLSDLSDRSSQPDTSDQADQSDMSDESDLFYARGWDFYHEERYTEAAESFTAAVNMRPDFWEAWQALGSSYYSLGRYQQALEVYEKVLQASPTPELEKFVQEIKVKVETNG